MRDNPTALFAYLALILFAALTATAATKWGIGTGPDSISYIDYALALTQGQQIATSHYPPAYPGLIGSIHLLIDGNIYTLSRYIHILIYCVNITLLLFITYRITNDHLLGLLAGCVFLTSAHFFSIHIYALSEPLFFLFLIPSLYLVSTNSTHKNLLSLLFISLLLAAGSMTRYAGIAAIIAAIIFVASRKQPDIKKVLFFVCCSVLPVLMWITFSANNSGLIGNRQIEPHLVTIDQVMKIFSVLAGEFLISDQLYIWLPTIIAFALYIFFVNSTRYRTLQKIHFFQIFLVIFILTYIAFILFSKSYLDALIPIDFRILSPVYICLVLLITTSIPVIMQIHKHGRNLRRLALALLTILIIIQSSSFKETLLYHVNHGIGFSSKKWAESDLIKQVHGYHEQNNYIIYSNAPEPIKVHAGIRSHILPAIISPSTLLDNPQFDKQIEIVAQNIQSQKALYVHFHHIDWRWYLPSLDSTMNAMDLEPIYEDKLGLILRSRN